MEKYIFRETAIEWLKHNGFDENEIDELQKIMSVVGGHRSLDDPVIIMPKGTSSKVAALVYVLSSITDEEGRPLCFDKKGFMDIPEEAQGYYNENLELQELEGAFIKLSKVKFGRQHSRAKRRGSVKDERY